MSGDVVRLYVMGQSVMSRPASAICKKCGGEKKPRERCVPCKMAYARAWYAANPEAARAKKRAWYADTANAEKVKAGQADRRARSKAWDAANPERARANHRAAYLASRESTLARRKAYRQANAEHYRAYSKKWRLAHPEQARALWRAAAIRRHGLTVAQYDAILVAQGAACKICRTTEPDGYGTWHIDHDHECCPGNRRSCGRCVRGLLCNSCNLMIGLSGDSPEVLRGAIEYLEASRLRAVAG